MKNDVYILSAKRTPIGSFGASLSGLTAAELGSHATAAALRAAGIAPEAVEEIFFGNVCSAGVGQAPARQIALKAGLPMTSPATTINKVCASGMKSVILAAQSIQLGDRNLMVAGGAESMSNIPYYATGSRWGMKYGDGAFVDGLAKDGLTDATENCAMGVLAERVCTENGISREAQDAFAIKSYERSKTAWENGWFTEEVSPITLSSKKGEIKIEKDEEFEKVDFAKLKSLRPAFDPNGTITAANASTLNDGAAALVLCSESALGQYNQNPIARILGYAETATDPTHFTLAPIEATKILLSKTGVAIEAIDLFEINEAFAMVPLAFGSALGVSTDQINVHGGAVSLGHPIGCSGARIITTLVHALRTHKKKLGLAAICNGGGGASAILIEVL